MTPAGEAMAGEGLAVVPIFVNVGAAALPAILAGLASAAALLLRPRELVRACIRRPVVACLVAAIGVGGWFAGGYVWGALSGGGAGRQPADGAIDWRKVAMAIIRRRSAAAVATAPARLGATIYRQDGSRCGHDGGPAPRRLVPLWEHREPDAMYLSSPAVVGRWVYGASCVLDPPTNYGTLFCLDARTGETRWLKEVLEGDDGTQVELKAFFSSPAVTADGKYLVIGQGFHYDRNCSLLCVRSDTGKLHWRVSTPLHIEGSPAVRGDLAVAGAGAIEGKDLKPIGDAGYVLGVRISDGRVLWRFALTDPESSPVIASDGVAYIGSGFNGSELVALRTETDAQLRSAGQQRVVWRRPTPYPATGAVTLVGEQVIIGCGNGNYVYASPNPAGAALAFDRRTGRRLWQVRLPDAVLGAVAVRGSKAICAVRNGEVAAIDLRKAALDLADEKKIAWRTRISGKAPVLAGAAFAGKFVYAVSKDGYLAVLDAADGKILEKHYINDEAKPGEMGLSVSSPTIAGGRLFVGTETGGVRCFASRSGPQVTHLAPAASKGAGRRQR